MKNQNITFTDAKILRKKAEEYLKKHPLKTSSPSSESEIQKLLQEIAIQGIELELQNKELNLAKEKVELEVVKYRNLVNNLGEGIAIVNTDEEIVFANSAGERIFGVGKGELIGKNLKDFSEKNHYLDLLNQTKIRREGKSNSYETEIVLPDGNKRTIHVSAVPQYDDNKRFTATLGIFIDITERKLAEKKLLYISKAVESASDAIGISDARGRHFYQNKALSSLFEYETAEELEAAGGGPAVVKDQKIAEEMYGNIKSGKSWSGELEMVTKSGRVFPAFERADAIKDINGNLVGLIGMITDFTERKHAEEALRESESSLQAVLQSTADGILAVNSENKVLFANDRFFEVWNIPPEIRSSRDDTVLLDYVLDQLTDPQGFLNKVLELYKSEKDSFDILYFKDGRIFERLSRPLILGAKLNGRVWSFRDVTTRRQAEMELIKAKERAEESDRLKSAFLANMSHEIRTPMNGILGFAGLLKEKGLSGETQQEYIRIIEKSGTRMLEIINDIIDISKIESGLMKTDIRESNINEQIEYIYTFFKPETETKGLKLSFKNSLTAKESIINTDREKVFAVLTNLVKNAIKFTDEGTIEFGYEKRIGFLEFFIKDSGIGIPYDRQQAIFDRFVQVDNAGTQIFQGAGLGLSISKAYVEMLGGKIWVESKPRFPAAGSAAERNAGTAGSTFYFTLPYKVTPEKNADNTISNADRAADINLKGPGLKILIAEDDKISEMLLSHVTKSFGKEILKAGTGIETVETCRNNPDIDLILMDIQMPEMNGYDAARQIRQFNSDVPIIAQTAFGLAGDREKALEAGCNDYIAKPINSDEFISIIQKHVK